MSAIRCPECKLINIEDATHCRRCGTALSPGARYSGPESKSVKVHRAARRLSVPVIAIVAVLCVYFFSKHPEGVSNPGARVGPKNKMSAGSVPARDELEQVKRLNRDFLMQLDQNAADPHGNGLIKNQTLALDTMEALKEQQNKISGAAARKYLDDFYHLVEKYHEQVVRLNAEITRLAEVRREITTEIEEVRQDPSVPPKDKIGRQIDIRSRLDGESQETSIVAKDLDKTVKSLRELSVSPTSN